MDLKRYQLGAAAFAGVVVLSVLAVVMVALSAAR